MNAVVFYSNTGQSRLVAEYFAKQLSFPLESIENVRTVDFQDLVLVFPVYCQNVPQAVKDFLKGISAQSLTLIATYGKMCCGNVLFEIQKRYKIRIVAGAYVPTKHSYIEADSGFEDFEKLAPLVEKIKHPSEIELPRLYKNPLADLFPIFRSRLGLTVKRTPLCNGCEHCSRICPQDAIRCGITNKKCIRCLRCVESCPRKALRIKLGLPLRLYLKKQKSDRLVIYI